MPLRKIVQEGEFKTGFVMFYLELTLLSTNAKVFIDFSESNRNRLPDTNVVASLLTEQPLRQVKILNDGGADFIRINVNAGANGTPVIKVKSNENLTIPFVDTEEIVRDMVLQASTSNTTVRIIGLA
jgi:hypothetical protein